MNLHPFACWWRIPTYHNCASEHWLTTANAKLQVDFAQTHFSRLIRCWACNSFDSEENAQRSDQASQSQCLKSSEFMVRHINSGFVAYQMTQRNHQQRGKCECIIFICRIGKLPCRVWDTLSERCNQRFLHATVRHINKRFVFGL